MKKHIYLLTLIHILCGCENHITIPNPDPDVKLVINADLNTDDQEHIIYIAQSKSGKSEGLKNARVRCLLNGNELTVEEIPVSQEDINFGQYLNYGLPYSFSAKINAGDKLRIEVSKDGLNAYCEVQAAEAVEILSCKSGMRTETDEYENEKSYYDYTLTFRDAEEDSWYRLKAEYLYDATVHIRYVQGNEEVNKSARSILVKDLNIISYTDPILNEGYNGDGLGEDDMLLGDFFSTTNVCKIFNDRQFRDSVAELDFSCPEYVPGMYELSYPRDDIPYGPAVDTRVEGTAYVMLSVESIPYESFAHYRALNNAENLGYTDNFLSEPTIFPSNITGGLGFVSIATKSTKVMEMGELVLP